MEIIMTKKEFIDRLHHNDKLVNKRCTESYLKKHNLLDWLLKNSPAEFESIIDKITFIRDGNSNCKTCGKIIKTHLTHCDEHKIHGNVGKIAYNKQYYDEREVIKLYKNGCTISDISTKLGINRVALRKTLNNHNIKFRSHSETQKISNTSRGSFSHDYDKEWWEREYENNTTDILAKKLGCSPTLVQLRLRKHNIKMKIPTSGQEIFIREFLDSIGIYYEQNYKSLGKELDFYIPEKRIAIELNGIYWHCELQGKTKNYHLEKTELCEKNNIQLLHFWDIEVNGKPEIVKSMIKSKLGLTKRIFARKCLIKEIGSKEAVSFLELNHLQGGIHSRKCLGLYHDDELVSVATLSKPRFTKKYDWELIRFATKLNTTVIGGLSKLMKYVNGTVISYANRRWSTGNVYDKCGFTFVQDTDPSYYWTGDFKSLFNRMKFQKHKLKDFPTYCITKSERQIMEEMGYTRVWDCGNKVYVISQ